jgi:hypothetical protein
VSTLNELIKKLEGDTPQKAAAEARAIDYLEKRANPTETATQKLARIKAERELERLSEGVEVDKQTGLPLEDAATREANLNKLIEARKKRKELLSPKKGRTATEAILQFEGKKKEIKDMQPDTKESVTAKLEARTNGGKQTEQAEPTPLDMVSSAYTDSSRYAANMLKYPNIFGPNPDFDKNMKVVSAATRIFDTAKAKIDNDARAAVSSLPNATPYHYEKAKALIGEQILPQIEANVLAELKKELPGVDTSKMSIQDIIDYVSIIRGEQIDLGFNQDMRLGPAK